MSLTALKIEPHTYDIYVRTVGADKAYSLVDVNRQFVIKSTERRLWFEYCMLEDFYDNYVWVEGQGNPNGFAPVSRINKDLDLLS